MATHFLKKNKNKKTSRCSHLFKKANGHTLKSQPVESFLISHHNNYDGLLVLIVGCNFTSGRQTADLLYNTLQHKQHFSLLSFLTLTSTWANCWVMKLLCFHHKVNRCSKGCLLVRKLQCLAFSSVAVHGVLMQFICHNFTAL